MLQNPEIGTGLICSWSSISPINPQSTIVLISNFRHYVTGWSGYCQEAESLIRQGQDEKPKFQERTGPPPPPAKARPPARKPPPQVQRRQPEPEPEPEPEVEPEPEPLPTEVRVNVYYMTVLQ